MIRQNQGESHRQSGESRSLGSDRLECQLGLISPTPEPMRNRRMDLIHMDDMDAPGGKWVLQDSIPGGSPMDMPVA